MNENLSHTATDTIKQWLAATTELMQETDVTSARLDCLILLEKVLNKDRIWILAHQDSVLDNNVLARLDTLVVRRLRHEPIAYIVATKEFYGREFVVSPDVLIPRPETEDGIDLLRLYLGPKDRLLDIGSGSGCIAITASLELPGLEVIASDISARALAVAQKNNQLLSGTVTFLQSNLFSAINDQYHAIIANLPYVDPSWVRSSETAFEPSIALFQKDNGLALIKQLLSIAPRHLLPAGYVLLEADPRQHAAAIAASRDYGFEHIKTKGFWLVFRALPAKSR